MDNVWIGCGTLVVVFLLVIILGLELRVASFMRRVEDKLSDALKKKE
jgi:hypothetical protein